MRKIKFYRMIKVIILILLTFNIKTVIGQKQVRINPTKNYSLLHTDSCSFDTNESKGIWNYNSEVRNDAFTGKYYSRATKEYPYAVNYKTAFPETALNKNIKLCIRAYAKCSIIENNASFGISITQKDSTSSWHGININNTISKANVWTYITDTLILPRSIVNSKNNFSLFLWNIDGKGTVDIDDLKIEYIELKTPSFIPEIKNNNIELNKADLLFKNNHYSLFYNVNNGSICIGNNFEDNLINELYYHIEYKTSETQKNIIQLNTAHFKLQSTENGAYKFTANDELINFELTINVTKNNELKFNTKTSYKKEVFVLRESLIANYVKDVNEVYTKNRKLDQKHFQNEYWLDKEGFKLGDKNNTVLIYHTSHISSLQLNTIKKQFVINLDYNYDHLRMRFPLLKNTTGKKIDVSYTNHKSKAISQTNFTIQCGIDALTIPRFMKNPNGFLATYIFTEHADFTDIKTQRAVNFGSEDIISFKDAIGGFAKFKIPVTKSVFYHNPEKTNNSIFNQKFNSEICNIKTTPNYLAMLNELQANNFEICLHTPEENTTSKTYLKEALQFFKTTFNSKNWIDHGYDNLQKNNREDFACDGFENNTALYSQPLFKEFGVNYFWNCYNEDSSIFNNYHFNNHIKHPFTGFGDFLPTPNYSKHWINGDTIISWQASSTLLPSNGDMWSYYFDDSRLQNFINDYEVEINHCYPARVDSLTGFYDLNENNKYVVNKNFNDFLQKLATHRQKGNINTTTIKDFINYNIGIENISYKIIDEHTVKLKNNNLFAIKGLSMIIKATNIKVNNHAINQKNDNGNTIFWFDLNVNEEAFITF